LTAQITLPDGTGVANDAAALFEPFELGRIALSNRIVMSPMTRSRVVDAGVPTQLNALYYRQRAGAGLIVTEGTQPSATGQGYPNTPGLHTDAQVAGWRLVTSAVHAEGGHIYAQIMHAGRISHSSLQPNEVLPVAPSDVRPAGQVYTSNGPTEFETPRALEADELGGIVAEFVDAATRAIAAGFDGVELHGANGYLLTQFLSTNTNLRTDEYGGSPQKRIRFVVDVVQAVAAAIGADRVGLRVSPGGTASDIHDDEVQSTYPALARALNPLGLAYLHVAEPQGFSAVDLLRPIWTGALIAAGGFNRDSAVATIAGKRADLVAFGHDFIANPDLPRRLARGLALEEGDRSSWYGGDEHGYTDYPAIS